MNQLNPKLNNLLEGIEKRSELAIQEIQKEKRELTQEFDEKTIKIINFIKFREKVDKIEAGYNLMFSPKEIKKMKNLTKETSNKLYSKALEKTKGDEKKAIALLFDPSSDISF